MPFWTPDTRWENSDVYIIGGGPSLSDFNWALLEDVPTIAVNAAFKLGPQVSKVCFFSDEKFFQVWEDELAAYSRYADVVTHCHALLPRGIEWLKSLTRYPLGLHTDGLGFGYNSGCGAVNLALLMGAKRVMLLGFDCKRPDDTHSHWHQWKFEVSSVESYQNFLQGWNAIAMDLPKVFPGREIINLNPSSAIPYFPKEHVSKYLHE